LLLLGVYSTAIGALSNLNLPIIAVIGAGVIVGFIVSSKVISYLLANFTYFTFAAIIGLIIGSVFVVYPGIPESGTPFVMSVIAFITGIIVANMFSSPNKASIEHH
jgi:putative membrane protein